MFQLIPWKRKQQTTPVNQAATDPFQQSLLSLRNEFDSMLSRFWDQWSQGGNGLSPTGVGWACDVDENENEYVVRAEAPGFDAEEFDVDVRGNYLRIQAEHKEEQRDGDRSRRYEYGRFQRTIPLPPGIDSENISARYHSGVLELHVPKRPEARGKRITVESA